jgi:Predicted integral membrane protein
LFFLGRYTAGNATARPGASSAIPEKSIAVLPLLNESGNPADEYFSDGLSEELIVALTQIHGLKVIGRSSSFRFKNKKEEPRSIGQKLGVSTLLEGTVRKQGERVRIVAELVKRATGPHFGHERLSVTSRIFSPCSRKLPARSRDHFR